jgi:hypothetical protein
MSRIASPVSNGRNNQSQEGNASPYEGLAERCKTTAAVLIDPRPPFETHWPRLAGVWICFLFVTRYVAAVTAVQGRITG